MGIIADATGSTKHIIGRAGAVENTTVNLALGTEKTKAEDDVFERYDGGGGPTPLLIEKIGVVGVVSHPPERTTGTADPTDTPLNTRTNLIQSGHPHIPTIFKGCGRFFICPRAYFCIPPGPKGMDPSTSVGGGGCSTGVTLVYPTESDSYEGAVHYNVDGVRVPHGKGRCVYDVGEEARSVYEGDWVDGKREGKGTMTTYVGVRYEGDWKNDMKNGKGTSVYPGGDKYEGGWENNRYGGKGTLVRADGSRFEGDWKFNVKEGKGTMVYPDGSRYEGDWKRNVKEGKGTMVYADGSRYEGDWKRDVKEGKGTHTYANGDSQVGEFREGKFIQ